MERERRKGSAAERLPRAFRALTTLLAVAVFAAGPAAVREAAAAPIATVGWIVMVSAASLLAVPMLPRQGVEASLRTPTSVASAVVLDPLNALLVNVLALASERELRQRPSYWMVAWNHVQLGLVAFLASLAAQQVERYGVVAMTLAAVLTYNIANDLAIAAAMWLLGRLELRTATQRAAVPFPRFATNFLLIALLAVLIVVLYTQVSPLAVGLLAVPLWLGYAALRSAREASDRAEELQSRVKELEVVNDLGTALLATRDTGEVVQLAEKALRAICEGHPDAQRVVVALDGEVPDGLYARPIVGAKAQVGLPKELDERRFAEAETVCATIGLALQRLEAEGHLGRSQQAQAALAARILAEGTIERSRVGLRVHDDVLPHLAAAQIQADNVLTAAEFGDAPTLKRLAAAVRDGVEGGIKTLRGVLDDLQRQTVVPGELVPWLQQAVERLHIEQGLSVELDTGGFTAPVSHATEILLAETIVGCLTNVVRHSESCTVKVRLRNTNTHALVDVIDHGVGFDLNKVGGGHHGLALMQQRAALVHGRFVVESAPGKGTTVHLHVPVGPTEPLGLLPPAAVGDGDIAGATSPIGGESGEQ
jgi:signal transduction histidine kinase